MRIDGINGVNVQTGVMNRQMGTDTVSKNIQNQIANAQKQLQELSSNKGMSMEEKMNKRQEIQQQIAELNNQLRQHQIEMRREQQQTKGSSMDDMLGGNHRSVSKVGNKSVGLSQASMTAIISADSAIVRAQEQGGVVTKMQGRVGVLETEIKLDAARGGNVEAKQEELAEVQQKVAQAQSAQMTTLADASKELEAAAKTDQQTEKTDGKDKKTDKKDAITNEKQDKKVSCTEKAEMVDTAVETITIDMQESVDGLVPRTVIYTHVDVRL